MSLSMHSDDDFNKNNTSGEGDGGGGGGGGGDDDDSSSSSYPGSTTTSESDSTVERESFEHKEESVESEEAKEGLAAPSSSNVTRKVAEEGGNHVDTTAAAACLLPPVGDVIQELLANHHHQQQRERSSSTTTSGSTSTTTTGGSSSIYEDFAAAGGDILNSFEQQQQQQQQSRSPRAVPNMNVNVTDLVRYNDPLTRQTSDNAATASPTTDEDGNDASGAVSPERERQILLLMLLAQVCSLHDATPRTFTVHVLSLFERGVLDRDSVGFLFDLGLVPRSVLSSTSFVGDGLGAGDLSFVSSSSSASSSGRGHYRRNSDPGPSAVHGDAGDGIDFDLHPEEDNSSDEDSAAAAVGRPRVRRVRKMSRSFDDFEDRSVGGGGDFSDGSRSDRSANVRHSTPSAASGAIIPYDPDLARGNLFLRPPVGKMARSVSAGSGGHSSSKRSSITVMSRRSYEEITTEIEETPCSSVCEEKVLRIQHRRRATSRERDRASAAAIRRHLERHESFPSVHEESSSSRRGGRSSRNGRSAATVRTKKERHVASDRGVGGPCAEDEKENIHVARRRPPSPAAAAAAPAPTATSWAVEHHPLSLSRYQREFEVVGPLASGSFGAVYRAKNKLDGRHYAVKRVVFSATGFANDALQMVMREVRCLAQCDHPNVVRYYTSWLEPSWMTGSSASQMSTDADYPLLLTDGGDWEETTSLATNNNAGDGRAPPSSSAAAAPAAIPPLGTAVGGRGGNDRLEGAGGRHVTERRAATTTTTTTITAASGVERMSSYSFDSREVDDDSDCSEWSNDGGGGQDHPHNRGHRHRWYERAGDSTDRTDVSLGDGDEANRRGFGLASSASDFSCGFDFEESSANAKGKNLNVDDVDGNAPNTFGKSRSRAVHGIYSSASTKARHGDTLAGRGRASNRNQHRSNDGSGYKYHICLFIQMQLCHPSTLADWIRKRNSTFQSMHGPSKKQPKHGDLHRQWAITAHNIFRQIVGGLAHVHGRGIIHRDLKPSNIFAAEDGVFKIGDFGLSKLLVHGANSTGSPRRADSGGRAANTLPLMRAAPSRPPLLLSHGEEPHTMGVGTASYAAPEQMSTDDYGKEADIFSLGLVLLELFSSFGTEHERAQAFQDCRGGSLPTGFHATYPAVAALVLACTRSEPAMRPTAQELLDGDDMFQESKAELYHAQVDALKMELLRKEKELEEKNAMLEERDNIIADLRRQLDGSNHRSQTSRK